MSGLRRDRKFELVLYPDSDSYDCDAVITLAQSYFSDWAYCLHYADTTDDGELKKAHIHFVGKLSDVKSPEVVCKDLGLPLNAISNIKNWKSILTSHKSISISPMMLYLRSLFYLLFRSLTKSRHGGLWNILCRVVAQKYQM